MVFFAITNWKRIAKYNKKYYFVPVHYLCNLLFLFTEFLQLTLYEQFLEAFLQIIVAQIDKAGGRLLSCETIQYT